jgi:hypothetical protein
VAGEDVPQTVRDFLSTKLDALPEAARMAVVFDPYGDLSLGSELKTGTHTWRVFRYDGNDLAFRKEYGSQPGGDQLIWVTCRPDWPRGQAPNIELRSMLDIWRYADTFLDASLTGVLSQLAPAETWPAESVWEHGDILGHNLPTVVSGLQTMRRYMGRGAGLDLHAIRALALHCLRPDIAVARLMFRDDTPARVLDDYLGILFAGDWDERGVSLLQLQAREAHHLDLGGAESWLAVSRPQLALYTYLRRFLASYSVPNIANQLRGLRVLDVDPGSLEPWAHVALARWNEELEWRRKVIAEAESHVEANQLSDTLTLLDLDTPQKAFDALVHADAPALLYGLGVRFFQTAMESDEVRRHDTAWIQERPATLSDLPETPYTRGATALADMLDEIAFISTRLRNALPEAVDLASLLDWYVEGRYYDLEYALARAINRSEDLPDPLVRDSFLSYLRRVYRAVREYLDAADHALADLIGRDWPAYLAHPRLAINVLRDTVLRRRVRPTADACLWVVIFDGMRWDSWERVVKPRLLERYEFAGTPKAYFSLLPSWTGIARTGLLAGQNPGYWRSYAQRFTKDESQLAARLFELPATEWRNRLRFYSGMESDRRYSQLRLDERFPYSILVYNVSDDNIHSQRGNLVALNHIVENLLDDILQVLDNLVRQGDTLVVTSDHGFVELEEGDEVAIADDSRWQRYMDGGSHPVHYRYITTHEIPQSVPDVYALNYPSLREKYAVAIGERWFRRADWRGPTDRYAHGGLSFAEMAVPAALMQRIVTRTVELKLKVQPDRIACKEGDAATITVLVSNTGNVAAEAQLTVQADTAGTPAVHSLRLAPTESRQVTYPFAATYRVRTDRTSEATTRVDVELQYADLSGRARRRRAKIAVDVTPRTDVVELDFGALEDLE